MADPGSRPIVFGATYSVYTRIARMALAEKGVDYRLEEVDIFADDGPPAGYLERHPFGRIPAFQHGDVRLFETAAICRYVDDVFDGPNLTPDDARARALMAQTIGVLDSYAYRAMVWDVYVEVIAKPKDGEAPDSERVEAGLKTAAIVLDVLNAQLGRHAWLAGDQFSLADLHAWPIFDDFLLAPPGLFLSSKFDNIMPWTKAVAARDAAKATAFPDD